MINFLRSLGCCSHCWYSHWASVRRSSQPQIWPELHLLLVVGLLVTGGWAATTTKSDQYIAFIMARLFGESFCGTAPALGADTIIDMFFLHERGKGLTVFILTFLGGVVVGPTLSGLISGSASWPVQFWWSNGLEAAIILLSLFLLEETYYDRTPNQDIARRRWPETFVANRCATFFRGSRVLPNTTMTELVIYNERVSRNTHGTDICRPRLSSNNS